MKQVILATSLIVAMQLTALAQSTKDDRSLYGESEYDTLIIEKTVTILKSGKKADNSPFSCTSEYKYTNSVNNDIINEEMKYEDVYIFLSEKGKGIDLSKFVNKQVKITYTELKKREPKDYYNNQRIATPTVTPCESTKKVFVDKIKLQ